MPGQPGDAALDALGLIQVMAAVTPAAMEGVAEGADQADMAN